MKVADILAAKGSAVQTVRRSDTIATLSKCLRDARVGVMIVSDNGETLDGIISERDIAYAFAERRGALNLVKVSALMTKDVLTCTPLTPTRDAALLMTEKHVRHLAVVDADKVVGVISMRDVLSAQLGILIRRAGTLKKLSASDWTAQHGHGE